jgi:hypothetical protein
MNEITVITMPNGSKWKPSTSLDEVHCVECHNVVDTPAEIATFPAGNCPECGAKWTGEENRSTIIRVTMPESLSGGAG